VTTKIVHEGRGGYVEIDDRRYPIEHVEGGRFAIAFPAGHRHAGRAHDREALEALVAAEPEKWTLDDRSRR
jgi:hypothetical protein